MPLGKGDVQCAGVPAEVAHALGLHGRDAQQVLEVGDVCGELGELRVQVRELARLLRGEGAEAGCRAGRRGARGERHCFWRVGAEFGLRRQMGSSSAAVCD
jgi:hypothetical protein